ncbi:carbon-nitrogen hydrolase family protein [Acidimangrovimonas pyrenivorans]|uniref:Carbon-nitrogen hydrolase family protein n=1 Tax=Acidimangrovimonas pyrenivorans TaxID=2030798 RepID=A0ABV7AJX3_9RHOB
MKIAVAQMSAVPGDVPGNLRKIDAVAARAAEAGAKLLLTPELILPGYGAAKAMAELAEPVDGPQGEALAEIADRHGLAVVAGFAEAADGAVFNSALFTDGTRAVVYRKSHLYGDYERGLFRPGPPEAATVEHGGLKFGLLICYDVEFPENTRRLARAGVDVVLVPTALPAGASADFIAQRMIPVRAFENQVFVLYADNCGADGRFTYGGQSHVAAPDGATLALAGPEAEELLICEIEPATYETSRAENTYLRDLRV